MNKQSVYEVRPQILIRLISDDIDTIMCPALEGGITDWCDEAEVVGNYLGEYAHEQIAGGGTLLLHDAVEDEMYELTLEKLLDGVKKYIENGGDMEIDRYSGNRPVGFSIDGELADSIVQCAVFGEVVYG